MPSRFLSVTTKGFETLHCCSTLGAAFVAPRPNATIRGRKVALAIRRGIAAVRAVELQLCELWHGCSCR